MVMRGGLSIFSESYLIDSASHFFKIELWSKLINPRKQIIYLDITMDELSNPSQPTLLHAGALRLT